MRWNVTRKMFTELKSKKNLKIRNHFVALRINDEIILNWIKNWDGGTLHGLIWLSSGMGGRLL